MSSLHYNNTIENSLVCIFMPEFSMVFHLKLTGIELMRFTVSIMQNYCVVTSRCSPTTAYNKENHT